MRYLTSLISTAMTALVFVLPAADIRAQDADPGIELDQMRHGGA